MSVTSDTQIVHELLALDRGQKSVRYKGFRIAEPQVLYRYVSESKALAVPKKKGNVNYGQTMTTPRA